MSPNKPNQLKVPPRDSVVNICIFFLVLGALIIFFNQPYTNLNADGNPVPHWTLLLTPLVDSNFVHDVWFGVNLPHETYTGERFLAFGLGSLATLILWLAGWRIFTPFSRALKIPKLERCFFSGLVGIILQIFYVSTLGFFHFANKPILPILLTYSALEAIIWATKRWKRDGKTLVNRRKKTFKKGFNGLLAIQISILSLFTSFYLLASTQPVFEYDALEYHIQGAREIFSTGTIQFSESNVYVNMPLGTEMTYVTGFNLIRDCGYSGTNILRLGSIVGKTILLYATLLLAFGILSSCLRLFRNITCALWGVIVFLSFPQLFEVYTSGLNDSIVGLALFSAVYFFTLEKGRFLSFNRRSLLSSVFLGVILGFAISLKYTAVPFVYIPIVMYVIISDVLRIFKRTNRKTNCLSVPKTTSLVKNLIVSLLILHLTMIAVGGGWYLRNAIVTGNPVYPLCYKIFGDKTNTWDKEVNARWHVAHSPNGFKYSNIKESVKKTMLTDELASPFFIFLPPIVCFLIFNALNSERKSFDNRMSRYALVILLIVILYWTGWFFFTHRITRFLVPISPFVSILLGFGIWQGIVRRSLLTKTTIFSTVLISLLYSGLMIDLLSIGRLAPLRSLEQDPVRFPLTAIYLNQKVNAVHSPNETQSIVPPGKLLLIGEARAAAFNVPVSYSTCWNKSALIQILNPWIKRNNEGRIVEITDSSQVVQEFLKLDVKAIYVDFGELARFRSPGNYGFRDQDIDERLFEILEEANVLAPVKSQSIIGDSSSVQLFTVNSNIVQLGSFEAIPPQ